MCVVGGTYCPTGSGAAAGTQCAAGWYGTAIGASAYTNSSCAGACSCVPGNACAPGSTAANGSACSAGFFCAGGTAQPLVCSTAGYFCPPGSPSQASSACAAGYYGSASGLTQATCSGVCTCSPGYFCGPASQTSVGLLCHVGRACAGGSAPPVVCAKAGFWCPPGSASPNASACAVGYYGAGAGAGAYTTANCAGSCGAAASPGSYCPPGSTNASGVPCVAGYCCPTMGAPVLCTSPGYWCPAGSVSSADAMCDAGYYGISASYTSGACQGPCTPRAGYFCAPGSFTAAGAPCPVGSYCVSMAAPPILCASGAYGLSQGLSTPGCTGPCNAGYYCPAGSTSATAVPCPPGTYAAVRGSNSSACQGLVRAGYFSTGGAVSPTDIACPPGRYGATPGATDEACSGPCAAGYYCDGAATSPTQQACPLGRFGSVQGASSSACTDACAAGTYGPLSAANASSDCVRCPAGSYSGAVGASAPSACLACAPGTYSLAPGAVDASTCVACPPGTASALPGRGDAAACVRCDDGYGSNSSACVVCAAGWAGTGGVCAPCPTGSFSRSPASASCELCPLGRASNSTAATSQDACALCAAGYAAPAAGGEECAPCAPGYFSGAAGAASCEPCPEGTYCTDSAADSAAACVPCFHSRFGPAGSSSAANCSACPATTHGPGCGSLDAAGGVLATRAVTVAGGRLASSGGGGGGGGAALFHDGSGAPVLARVDARTRTILLTPLDVTGSGALALSTHTWAVAEGSTVVLRAVPTAPLDVDEGRRRARDLSATRALSSLDFGCAVAAIAILDDGASVAAACAGGTLLMAGGAGGGAVTSSNIVCAAPRAMGDLNGDGRDDVLCGNGSAVIVALVSRDTGALLSVVPLALALADGDDVAPLGDFDGDGVPDVAVAGAGGVRVVTLRRDGSVRASAYVASGAVAAAAGLGDVDGDGVGDLLLAAAGGLVVANVSCPQCARALASDTGGQPGLGDGDSLTVQLPCAFAVARGPLSEADLAAVLTPSAPLGSAVAARWVSSSSLVLRVLNASGQASVATRVGALTVRTHVCNGSALYHLAGSWGPHMVPPRIRSVVARNSGGQPGLGPGDEVVVTMDVDTNASAVLAPNASVGVTSARWVDGRTWRLVIADTSGADGPAVTRVGALVFAGRVRSADGTSPPGAVEAPLGGSWGDFPAPRIVSATAADTARAPGMGAGDTLNVTFDMDTSMPPAAGVIAFSAPIGEFTAAWVSGRTLLYTLTNMSTAAPPALTRVGTLMVSVVGDLRSVDLSSPRSTASAAVGGAWGNAVTGITNGVGGAAAAQRLATAGGQTVTLWLAATLGEGGDPVSATYSNGAYEFAAPSCAVGPSGDVVACTTAPGVGAGFVWHLVLRGVALPVSSAATGYAAPVITRTAVLGAEIGSTDGGQEVQISGSSFGPARLPRPTVSGVFFFPRGFPDVVFAPTNCSVTVDDVQVTCTMPPCAGSDLVFSMRIGNQSTTDVTLAMLGPVLHAVVAPDGPLRAAGGTHVRLLGRQLGVAVAVPPAVSYGPGLAFAALNCSVVVPHVEIACVAAPGYGRSLSWQVSVLGRTSDRFASTVSYEDAVVAGPAPGGVPVPTAGGVVVLQGAGFPEAYPAAVTATLDGATLRVSAVTYTTVTVSVPPGVGAAHALTVTVAGGAPGVSVPLPYAPPVVAQVGPTAGGDLHWDVAIMGTNFGAVGGAVNITIGGVPCAVLTVADTVLVCRTTVMAGGATTVTIGGQAAASSPPFAPDTAAPSPALTGAVSVVAGPESGSVRGLPLAGGGTVRIAGVGLGAPYPAYGVLLETAGPAWDRDVDCARAQALRKASLGSDVCVGGPSWSASAVLCTLPRSSRALIHVAVVDLWFGPGCYPETPTPVALRYDPPAVASVEPALLGTRGGDRLTLRGAGFPADTRVAIGGAPCAETLVLDDTTLLCTAPPGVGANVSLSLNSSAYPAPGVLQALQLSYLPPRVSTVSPGTAPCVGGARITLLGSQLGRLGALDVSVGPFACAVVSVSSDGSRAVATVPPGVGAALDVVVRSGNQVAVAPAAFSYAPPIVTGISPGYVNAAAGAVVAITGANFVPLAVNVSAISVAIGGSPCGGVVRGSDGAISCTSPPMPVHQSAALVVTVGGQAGSLAVPVWCPPGFYGLIEGALCSACPAGAACAGTVYEPAAIAGYARTGPAAFVACVPPESCLAEAPRPITGNASASGGSGAAGAFEVVPNCAEGYTASQCRSVARCCLCCPSLACGLLRVHVIIAP